MFACGRSLDCEQSLSSTEFCSARDNFTVICARDLREKLKYDCSQSRRPLAQIKRQNVWIQSTTQMHRSTKEINDIGGFLPDLLFQIKRYEWQTWYWLYWFINFYNITRFFFLTIITNELFSWSLPTWHLNTNRVQQSLFSLQSNWNSQVVWKTADTATIIKR